ncbi:MAG: hypothetical protein AAF639_28205 [Chloroflexota bacterium]
MTQLLEQAMGEVYKLPPEKQDIIAITILDKLQEQTEVEWSRTFRRLLSQLVQLISPSQNSARTYSSGNSISTTQEKPNGPPQFPDLAEFRASIQLKGEDMSNTVIQQRRDARY